MCICLPVSQVAFMEGLTDEHRATVVGLGQIELRSYKMRTSKWTVIIRRQVICTAKFKGPKVSI